MIKWFISSFVLYIRFHSYISIWPSAKIQKGVITELMTLLRLYNQSYDILPKCTILTSHPILLFPSLSKKRWTCTMKITLLWGRSTRTYDTPRGVYHCTNTPLARRGQRSYLFCPYHKFNIWKESRMNDGGYKGCPKKTVKWRKILSRTLSDLYLQCFRILPPTFERTLLENPRLALDQNIWIGIFQPKSAENTSVIVVWWNVNLHTSRSYGSCWHFRDSESPSHIFHRTWLLTFC